MMQNQAQSHAECWYRYANNPRIRARNGELYLVTGADKSANWCLGAFPNASGDRVARFTSTDDASSSTTEQFEPSGSATARTCPVSGNRKNQCAFLRGFKIMLDENIYSKSVKALSMITSHPNEILATGNGYPGTNGALSNGRTGQKSGETTVCDFPDVHISC
jgi:hypothetical protein